MWIDWSVKVRKYQRRFLRSATLVHSVISFSGFAPAEFRTRAFRNVELVEDVEGREHGVVGGRVRHRRLAVDRRAHEARGRGEIAGKAEQPGARAEGFEP